MNKIRSVERGVLSEFIFFECSVTTMMALPPLYTPLSPRTLHPPAQACILKVTLSAFLEQTSELHAQMISIISYF